MPETMTREDIILRVKEFLAQDGGENSGDLKEDADLFAAGALDSLQTVSLVVFLEEKFACSFDHEELTEDNLRSMDSIAAMVLGKIQTKGSA